MEKSQVIKKIVNKGKEYYLYRCPSCDKERTIKCDKLSSRDYCQICSNIKEPRHNKTGQEWCGRCKKYKDLSDFNIRKDGKKRQCKECERQYRANNRVMVSKTIKKWFSDNPQKRLFYSSKKRAKDLGLNFDLEPNDIKIPKKCPILEIPIIADRSGNKINSPSIDRIFPERGYVKDNIQIISWRANWIKNNASFDEIKKLYLHMKKLKENGDAEVLKV